MQPTADPNSPASAPEAEAAGGAADTADAVTTSGADITGTAPTGTDSTDSTGTDSTSTDSTGTDSASTDSTDAGSLDDEVSDIQPGMALPLPDDAAGAAARDRLTTNDIGVNSPTIAALGLMADAVVFIAAVQSSAFPRPLLSTRVVMLSGHHAGGVVAGPAADPRGGTPLQHLAMTAGAGIVTLEWQPAAAAIEHEDAITPEQMDAALRAGWAEADRAADEGIELLVLAAGGAGAATAAAAVVAAVTGAEPPALLARVVTPAGLYDDNAWMTRCLALRDALHRVRQRDGGPRTVLSALGGADLAAATGLILGAASRRTPVMIDGPVGAAAALVANDFSPQSRSWIVLPDTGRHPAVRLAAEALQLRPWLDLCLDLGEGAASLAALPMLQTALTLASAGEQVESTSLSRFDSTGNQVFVGVAKPVEPTESEAGSEAGGSATAENAAVGTGSAEAEPAGTAPTKAKSSKSTSAKNTVKGPTRTATPPKTPAKTAKSTNKTAAGKFPATRRPSKAAKAAASKNADGAKTDSTTPAAAATDPAKGDSASPDPTPASPAASADTAKSAPDASSANNDAANGGSARNESADDGSPSDESAEQVEAFAGAPRPRKRS